METNPPHRIREVTDEEPLRDDEVELTEREAEFLNKIDPEYRDAALATLREQDRQKADAEMERLLDRMLAEQLHARGRARRRAKAARRARAKRAKKSRQRNRR